MIPKHTQRVQSNFYHNCGTYIGNWNNNHKKHNNVPHSTQKKTNYKKKTKKRYSTVEQSLFDQQIKKVLTRRGVMYKKR